MERELEVSRRLRPLIEELKNLGGENLRVIEEHLEAVEEHLEAVEEHLEAVEEQVREEYLHKQSQTNKPRHRKPEAIGKRFPHSIWNPEVLDEVLNHATAENLLQLSPRQREVLVLRTGIGGERKRMREISKMFDITPQAVNCYEHLARKNLLRLETKAS